MANSVGLKNARIEYERVVTIDDILAEAQEIWTELLKRKLPRTEEASNKFISEMTRSHKQFFTSYPIVCKYMCHMYQYNHKALKLWLGKIQLHPWHSETEYIDAQADYVAILYRTQTRHASQKDVNAVRDNARRILLAEHTQFKNLATGTEKRVVELEERLRRKNARELVDFILSNRDAVEETLGLKDVTTPAPVTAPVTEPAMIDVDMV